MWKPQQLTVCFGNAFDFFVSRTPIIENLVNLIRLVI